MKCPYCNNEMKLGVIQSPHEINWKPKKSYIFGNASFHEDAVVLSELSLFKGSCVNAYHCLDCKKIIIAYGEEDANQ
jgi:hypothetical protein